MSIASSLKNLAERFQASPKMPLVFLGHGSPMNAIEDTAYSRSWSELGQSLPRPQAILMISAHWMTQGSTLVDVSAAPRTIHDFYGFPDELYQQQYPAKGAPELAKQVASMLADFKVQTDDSWGLDHGAWTLLHYLYPAADVPVFQLSIDITKDLNWQLGIGKALAKLRERGVLIIGSGNVVHNLRALQFNGKAHDWALEFDSLFADKLNQRDLAGLADAKALGSLLRMANPTFEHYAPALTIAGAASDKDQLIYTSEGIDLGSVSMRSFMFHA